LVAVVTLLATFDVSVAAVPFARAGSVACSVACIALSSGRLAKTCLMANVALGCTSILTGQQALSPEFAGKPLADLGAVLAVGKGECLALGRHRCFVGLVFGLQSRCIGADIRAARGKAYEQQGY
jgi:hypothetical protein